jgi:RimJ/RimL family protein N-acetyltransferase
MGLHRLTQTFDNLPGGASDNMQSILRVYPVANIGCDRYINIGFAREHQERFSLESGIMTGKQIRPLKLNEHWSVIEYFHNASDLLLETMGVDRNKFISKEEWFKNMEEEFTKELSQKQRFYIGWEYNGELIGHSSISNIKFGDYANIHLHIWQQGYREKGLGIWFFKQSINYFFKEFELSKLICEPYAENPAPNRVLKKLGLVPVKKYLTTPGLINFEQFVNRYEITAPFGD